MQTNERTEQSRADGTEELDNIKEETSAEPHLTPTENGGDHPVLSTGNAPLWLCFDPLCNCKTRVFVKSYKTCDLI